MKKWSYGKWILGAEAVGGLSGFLSRKGMEHYKTAVIQPSFAPPPAVFPVAWGLLYALMGIGAARIWAGENTGNRKWALNLFFAQLTVNFFWSLIFFNARAYGFALLWLLLLLVLVLGMTVLFWRCDRLAGVLQIPYVLWLCFAGALNYGVWQLNG